MLRTSLAFLLFCVAPLAMADEPSQFARTTIDIGTVVTDLDAAVKFYTEGIGFRELKGFQVTAELATAAGLTDNKPLDVRVLVLGEEPTATKLKLMQVAETTPRSGDNAFIHSHTGFRYLTIMVTDTATVLARLKALGVTPLAQSPVNLKKLVSGKSLTCVKDPDGNLVELIGPTP